MWEDRSDRLDWDNPDPLWSQVADDLRSQITAGSLPPGSRLPSESEIGGMYGVARGTARQAVRALREEGLVVVRVGKGAYVRKR